MNVRECNILYASKLIIFTDTRISFRLCRL